MFQVTIDHYILGVFILGKHHKSFFILLVLLCKVDRGLFQTKLESIKQCLLSCTD